MANQIESIQKIDKELEVVISSLKDVGKEITDISKLARELSGAFNSVKTPDKLNDTLKTSANNTEQLNAAIKEQNKLERKLISTIAKKTLIQESTAKSVAKESEDIKILKREQRNQVKSVSQLANAYEKVNAQLNLQIREYQGLSVAQKQGAKLTDIQKKRFDELSKSIQVNRKTLQSTDAEVGRFQRNVGNYASGFDGLGNSIAQLTREAPAFAVSMSTGFLALSNNIPILADEIQRLSVANKKLAADGKATKSVFSQVAKSFFGFQTLLSLGVLVLTLYGDKIVKFIGELTVGVKKIDAIAESQKEYNEAVKEGTKAAVNEISQMQILLKFSSDITKSTASRNKAVDKLIKSSGGLIKEQDRLNILNGDAIKIEEKLTKAILNKAIIQQLQTKIGEELNDVLDAQLNISKLENEQKQLNIKANNKLIDTDVEIADGKLKLISKTKELTSIASKQSDGAIKFNKINKETLRSEGEYLGLKNTSKNIDKDIIKLKKQNADRQSKINELIKSALKLTDDYTLGLDGNTKSIKERNKAVAFSSVLAKERESDLKLAIEQLKVLNELYSDDESFKLPELNAEDLNRSLKEINSRTSEQLKDLFDDDLFKDALGNFAGTLEDFTGISGDKFLTFFDKIKDGGIDSFEEIAEVAQLSFSLIGDASNSFFQSKIDGYQNDIDANNEYYQNLLDNDNLTEEERTRLEKDRENKEKDILKKKKKEQEKQAIANKAFAVADIILSTAKGIASAASSVVTLPLVPFIAGIGAAELAIALATPIPKFAEGGIMGHDGAMMINDHKSGRLEVVERDGKLLMTDKRNAIVEGKKGDVIHKDAKEYFNNLSDSDILKDVNNHSMMATLQSQNYLISKLDNKKVIDAGKENTDRLINVIKRQKTKFNVHQNITLADDLKLLDRSNNTL